MDEVLARIAACLVCTTLFCIGTWQSLGAMQQGGYQNGKFMRWLRNKDNLLFNRLWVWALCLALSSAVTALCFSFLGTVGGLAVSAIPFLGLSLFFVWADRKYALKVPVKNTPRCKRLFVAYYFITAVFSYIFIAVLAFLAKWNGSGIYAVIAYVPFAATPVFLPILLCAANGVMCVFEKAHNEKFIKRAGQVLNQTEIIRVAVVGSYGKTSVKHILATVLAEKYSVAYTPASYNTPLGIALTVNNPLFAGKQVFIAEMGARKAGDIQQLCDMVKPNFAIFTGVCPQHVETFGSLENVWQEKSKIFQTGAKVVCAESLQERVGDTPCILAKRENIKNINLQATKTSFTLTLDGQDIQVETTLLGEAAIENILLAATLAYEMGLSVQEIASGLSKVQPIPHRLQLIQSGSAYILDDGYNANVRGAGEALKALCRFSGRRCVVTPVLVECGILQAELNGRLGEMIANAKVDKVILVGETLVGAVKNGYIKAGGNAETCATVKTLTDAQALLQTWIGAGDCVLFLNDLPDVY